MQILLGLSLGVIIGIAAFRAGALSRSGAWMAALTGGLIFGLGGLPWAALLLTFFISSSALSRAFARRKESLGDTFAKSSQRDHGQVLANGGLGALLAVVHALAPESPWPWIAFTGAMAAVNADTWATELGVLSPFPPRLITNGKPVERGASGGVTLAGYLAVLGGSALIGLGAIFFSPETSPPLLMGSVMLAGLAGSTFDSFLGATVQAIYTCPSCRKETERYPRHRCGTETVIARGWPWMNNDMVNFACSLAGASATVIVFLTAQQLFN
jgi:uncharacterized protein (TIGR00297 family)